MTAEDLVHETYPQPPEGPLRASVTDGPPLRAPEVVRFGETVPDGRPAGLPRVLS